MNIKYSYIYEADSKEIKKLIQNRNIIDDASKILTENSATDIDYFLNFVDSNNSSTSFELIYTQADLKTTAIVNTNRIIYFYIKKVFFVARIINFKFIKLI